MSSGARSYRSPISAIAICAMNEAQKTITAVCKRFDRLSQVATFIVFLTDMIEMGDYKAAKIVFRSISQEYDLTVSPSFARYIKSEHIGCLLAYYTHFLVDLYFEAFISSGDAEEKPCDVPHFRKMLYYPNSKHDAVSDNEYTCILCQALQHGYKDSPNQNVSS